MGKQGYELKLEVLLVEAFANLGPTHYSSLATQLKNKQKLATISPSFSKTKTSLHKICSAVGMYSSICQPWFIPFDSLAQKHKHTCNFWCTVLFGLFESFLFYNHHNSKLAKYQDEAKMYAFEIFVNEHETQSMLSFEALVIL